MESHSALVLSFIGFLLFASSLTPIVKVSARAASDDGGGGDDGDASRLQTYIIRVRPPENVDTFAGADGLEKWYKTFMPPGTMSDNESRIIHVYSEAITGFAATLTDTEVMYIKQKEGFVDAFPDRLLQLMTTHTPAFLGLQPGHALWSKYNMGKGVIIGVLDTGITLGHPSFNDHGMQAPPSTWKGVCEFQGGAGSCNKKIIGARALARMGSAEEGNSSVVDFSGHGTHTASTAAGNFVRNANVLGSGNGTAAGMAPRSHLAIYQVCSLLGCFQSDVIAGMDAAIKDGVDVLSLSLGGGPINFYNDVIAIGAFSAMKKGIFVSCAAGNFGPIAKSLTNEAPWILTVGASTTDRNIRATVRLGNGQEFDGETAYQPRSWKSRMLPLVYPVSNLTYCNSLTIDNNVKGKIVLCRISGSRIGIGQVVKRAGGAGMILINDEAAGYTTFAEAHYLPAAHLSYAGGSSVLSYMRRSKNPKAMIIFKGTVLGVSPSPTVSCFSSRGPTVASRGILKPDIIGPGVNVLAAWPFEVGPAPFPKKHPRTTFNIISGTSMSTPHLSGIAALIKRAHPDWSPAAIKSAIMTTSYILDRNGKRINDEQHKPAPFFAIGAGHVNPRKTLDPGLVFDLDASDYVHYLCGLGYTDHQVESVTHQRISCADVKKIDGSELNYPSLTVAVELGKKAVQRTVLNVGKPNSTYTAKTDIIAGVYSMKIKPRRLRFSDMNEKKSFTVSMKWKKNVGLAEGNIWWVSGKYSVRMPVLIF